MNRRQGRRLREWTRRGGQRSVPVLGPEGDGYGGGGETELKEEEVWPRFVFLFHPFPPHWKDFTVVSPHGILASTPSSPFH